MLELSTKAHASVDTVPSFAAAQRDLAVLSWLVWRPYAATVALTILCAVLFLPGIASFPVTDRDEARFAQASKQMVETGDIIDIRFQDAPRYKKPIGIYWLQAASVIAAEKLGASRGDIWPYRVPSFLGALGAVLLLFWLARPIVGRRAAFIAAALFASCFTLAFEARIAKSDAALIATLVLMQGCLFRLYLARDPGRTPGIAALFWLGLGGSILIKGPIGPALTLCTATAVLLLDKHRNWLRNLHWRWGLPLTLAVVLPWFIAIGISSHGAFFQSSLGQDFAGKLQSGQEAHGAPPGYYLLLTALTFWPVSLFLGTVPWRTFRLNRRVIFLVSWLVPFWLLIEAFPTKLPHYVLPLYPVLALFVAVSIVERSRRVGLEGGNRSRLIAGLAWVLVAAALFTLMAGVMWVFEEPFSLAATACLVVYAGAAVTAVRSYRANRVLAAFAASLLAAICIYTAAFRYALPNAEAGWLSRAAYAAAQSLPECGSQPVAFAGYTEPSAVFAKGTKTVLDRPEPVAERLAAHTVSLAFVKWQDRTAFETKFRETTGAAPRFAGCVDAMTLNGRGPTRLHIYASPTASPSCVQNLRTSCPAKASVRWRRLFDTKF